MTPPRLTARQVARWLPARRRDAHKGEAGHVLVLAGSRGMSGAAILCAQGAVRGGAGLVTAACPRSQQPIVAGRIAEALTLPLPETREGSVAARSGSMLIKAAEERRINALVIGPGLSARNDSAILVERLLQVSDHPVVLDADGLNALARRRPLAFRETLLHARRAMTIITPHPGELARWAGTTPRRIQQDRVGWARRMSRDDRVVCILKGHHTVVASGRKVTVNPTGNPGMATGGSGDVLAGLIGALLAQGLDPWHAACAGVYLHGLAGDLEAHAKGSIGLSAGDIAEALPLAIRRVRG